MALLVKPVLFFLGFLVCAWKGGAFLVNPIDPNGRDVSRQLWGLNDKRLDPEWARVGGNEPLSHTLTNIVVEWFEMDRTSLRRGVKLFSFFIVLSALCGFALGLLI